MTVLDRPAATSALPERFVRWFASRGWTPRAHQLELLAKARAGRSVLLIAPTGAGKTLAGFLPSLVELSTDRAATAVCSLPRLRGRGGEGGGGRLRVLAVTPLPVPPPQGGGDAAAPTAWHARGHCGFATSASSRHAASSPPAATSAARAGCTRSTSRRSRRSRSTSRAISSGRSPRWRCRSASRPAPATRRPSKRQRQRRDPPHILLTTPEQLALILASPDAPFLFGSLRRIVLDELHSLVVSKRGDLLSLGLARLFTLAPDLTSVGLSATVAEPDDLRRYLVPQRPGGARACRSGAGGRRRGARRAHARHRRAAAVGRAFGAPCDQRNLRPDQAPQDHAGLRQHPQPGRKHLPGAVGHQRRRPCHRAASRLARCRATPQGRGRDGGRPSARGGRHLLARSRHRLGRRRSGDQCRRAEGRFAAAAAHRPRQSPHGRALEGRADPGQPLRGAGVHRRARRQSPRTRRTRRPRASARSMCWRSTCWARPAASHSWPTISTPK